ncbi:MAG TPA: inositol monophosphatase, partial [Devosia sp.]|nr:inositol monophosphatase [Devosia sp.]
MAASTLLNIMIRAAQKAGRALTRDFGEVENLQVSRKGPADFVSNADLNAEEIIRDELLKARPTYSFLLEEGGEIKGEDGQHRWIVDPLDGTTNFLHGIPLFASCIALERNGDIIASVIYNPIMEETFTAERGGGAWLDGRKRLRVAARRRISDCLAVTGINSKNATANAREIRQLAHITPSVAGIRRSGSACLDLAWLAAGRYDIYWEANLSPWD